MPRSFWVVLLALGWPASLFALVQGSSLPSRPHPPESAYPNCLTAIPDGTGTRRRLEALRICRSSIEGFRTTYLTQFRERMRAFASNLERYREIVTTGTMTPVARRVSLDAYEREKELLSPGGELFEVERRLSDRVKRELALIGGQICRLRHRRPGSYCA